MPDQRRHENAGEENNEQEQDEDPPNCLQRIAESFDEPPELRHVPDEAARTEDPQDAEDAQGDHGLASFLAGHEQLHNPLVEYTNQYHTELEYIPAPLRGIREELAPVHAQSDADLHDEEEQEGVLHRLPPFGLGLSVCFLGGQRVCDLRGHQHDVQADDRHHESLPVRRLDEGLARAESRARARHPRCPAASVAHLIVRRVWPSRILQLVRQRPRRLQVRLAQLVIAPRRSAVGHPAAAWR
mmetsp:Transcript_69208/g.180291  ORF Transcript_69208/g.180291 Transcript_69208/m.180291 type:complete len:242 (-) Transcript_69208:37-762(-)